MGLVALKKTLGCSWHFVNKMHGIVVATTNPSSEKGAQMFKTIIEGKMTVKNFERPNMTRPKNR